MRHNRRKWFFLFPFIFVAAAAFFGWLVMTLWNAALVPATGAALITFWQALGLLVLSRILVGGFGGGKRRGHRHGGHWMREKWMNMTPEEREQFKAQWGQWRGGCGRPASEETTGKEN